MTFLYADVILPLPLPRLFTYHVPDDMESLVAKGMRVVVPFGRKKQYSGIIFLLHGNKPEGYDTKPLITILDRSPLINSLQLKFWGWMSNYYQCSMGEVYKAALPSGLKLESETRIYYNPHYEQFSDLPARAEAIIGFLSSKKAASVQEINDFAGVKNAMPILKTLFEEGAVFVTEHLKEGFRPKTENYLMLSHSLRSEESLGAAFDALQRAPKQMEALMYFLNKCGGINEAFRGKSLSRKALLESDKVGTGVLSELINKELLDQFAQEVDRLDLSSVDVVKKNLLTPEQEEAFRQIKDSFNNHNVALLQGVTSSGKTEVYIHLIEEYLQQRRQVLYLLPEIALTTQITSRLKQHFGNSLGIYHSKYSNEERVEVWQNLLEQKTYQVILGVRSSVFLPFDNLGLVIVDEEHEYSFKQFDPAPRYHARDSAIMLAHLAGAKVLLGTATPAIESFYNAQTGKYGFVQLAQRFGNIKMPQVVVADTREARRRKQMKSLFTPILLEYMNEAFQRGEQVILFQNRRGFSPFLECDVCAWVPRCKFCDVSMTYHKKLNHLICHYCGHTVTTPSACSACGSSALSTRGFGTEKVEEEIALIFPKTRVARMDFDTTRSKKAYQDIISGFENRQFDILIGTQMVSKGLDFDNVSLVGILNSDQMLNMPDFRAFERSYQMMAQVSGRAGRKNRQGTVVLQTSDPEHPIVKQVIDNDYEGMYRTQLQEREAFLYPPYCRLINILVKHKNRQVVDRAAEALGQKLKAIFGSHVLGPQEPPVSRIQNLYLSRIILKVDRKKSPSKAKEVLQRAVHSVSSQPRWRYVTVQVDVDPI